MARDHDRQRDDGQRDDHGDDGRHDVGQHDDGQRDDHGDREDFGGFRRDRPLLGRRRALGVLAGAGAAGLVAACSSSEPSAGTTDSTRGTTGGAPTSTGGAPASPATTTASPATTSPTTSPASTTAGATTDSTTDSTTSPTIDPTTVVEAEPGPEIPDETGGPFPADGTNGPNVLTTSGVDRADLTNSFGGLTGTAEGVPMRFDLHIVDAASGSPLPDAAVYLWHCTADGRYSLYEISDQNYLRGLQTANGAGVVTFTTVFPGCYRGRWPHAHFEVFESAASATDGGDALKGSQLAIPEAPCTEVYADARYGDSAGNLSQLSLDSDGVFRDGWSDQLATVTGSTADGYVASLLVRV